MQFYLKKSLPMHVVARKSRWSKYIYNMSNPDPKQVGSLL